MVNIQKDVSSRINNNKDNQIKKWGLKKKLASTFIITAIFLSSVECYLILNKHNDESMEALPPLRPDFVIDSHNDLHVFWMQDVGDTSGIYYLKLNDEGVINISANKIIVSETRVFSLNIYIDSMDFIHLNYGPKYAKMDIEGNVIEMNTSMDQKTLFPGHFFIKDSANKSFSFWSNETMHPNGNYYTINNNIYRKATEIKILDINGNVSYQSQIDENWNLNGILKSKILVDDDFNIHVYLLLGSGFPILYGKYNSSGSDLIELHPLDTKYNTTNFNVIRDENDFLFSYSTSPNRSIQMVIMNTDGLILDEQNIAKNCYSSEFLIDNNQDICMIFELSYKVISYAKYDENYVQIIETTELYKYTEEG